MAIARSFKAEDPKEKQQKVAAPEVLAYMYTIPKAEHFTQHIADIINGAYFFIVVCASILK